MRNGTFKEVALVAGCALKSLWRRARADGSYASANDPRVLAGLADRPAVSGVVVHWPSGRIEAFDAGAVKSSSRLSGP